MNEQMKNKKKEEKEKEKQLQLQIRQLTRQAVLWLLNHLSNFESNFQKLAVNCLHPTEL